MKIFLAALKVINWFLSKRQKNYLTGEPSAPIVDEATSEKIIMETQISPLEQVLDWAVDKIETMEDHSNALALVSEFKEWINAEENQQIDYLCLEEEGWGEQEIDIR